jgi:carbon-monoxide dehydrogenase medium subunit
MLHDFTYVHPDTLDDALSFIRETGERSRVFSGGTDLFVDIRSSLSKPEFVVDLKGIEELHTLAFDRQAGLSIGACVTVNELIEDPAVIKHYPILVVAGKELATHQLRNRASVVGNIVTASPCGDMGSPLLCLEAEVEILSRGGSKRLLLADFITGVKQTALGADELVTRIVVPTTMLDARGWYRKLKRIRGHDLGVVSVALVRHGGILRFAISSAAPTPVLLPDFPASTAVEEIQGAAQKAISPIDDVRCSAEYRAFMVDVFIEQLMGEVKG